MNDRKYLLISIVILAIALSVYFYRQNRVNKSLNEEAPYSSQNNSSNDLRIDINTAEINMLICLPGIGEVTAGKIIEYRDTHNGFDSIEEIMNISGIKEKRFEQIRDYIYVSP